MAIPDGNHESGGALLICRKTRMPDTQAINHGEQMRANLWTIVRILEEVPWWGSLPIPKLFKKYQFVGDMG